ncbi:MAG: pyrimidine 5'-nucleotidase [Oxalicibacterium faecigallinarum]|uniref:pyrimidine 5'-nucleotidase n=1 Tax=Oxalicibacterium faecigallinarum TaxID=573741 RepID=UPI002806D392|nr:pyrimidine 5'-nucleotidase [Oxalicibacterium faecigallinarum]MDQ7969367.1 pyrimidine 5'-nucleotidase [Oxalicibacterium faecigallinarum]
MTMRQKAKRLTWLFDLDNTLHDASHAIFPAIHQNMNVYIAKVLQSCGLPCDTAAVDEARIGYWQRYGATLLGMVHHHQVKADDFLREAHRFDNLHDMIRAERNLVRILHKLPGRKILLTNAPRIYSHDVMRHLGLHRHFARHVPIEAMRVHGRLRPKPSKLMLKKLMAAEGLRPRDCILIEDTVENLKGAKTLGLRTAWITQYLSMDSSRQAIAGVRATTKSTKRPIYVDVKVKSVGQLFRQLHRLR